MVSGTSNIDYRDIEPRILGPLTSKMLKGILFSIPFSLAVYYLLDQFNTDLTTQLTAAATVLLPAMFFSSSKMNIHGLPFLTYLYRRLRRPFTSSLKYTYRTETEIYILYTRNYELLQDHKPVKKSKNYTIYR